MNLTLSKLLKLGSEQRKFNKLVEHYLVTSDMTAKQIFDNFIAQEALAHSEFMGRALAATTATKRKYWFDRASGLTTKGGQSRLRKLLTLAKKEPVTQ